MLADAMEAEYNSIDDYKKTLQRIDHIVNATWNTIKQQVLIEKENVNIKDVYHFFNDDLISFGSNLHLMRGASEVFRNNLCLGAKNLKNPNKALVLLESAIKITEMTEDCI